MLLVAWSALTSCSGDDYLNAIPAKSTALVSVDLQALSTRSGMEDKAGALKKILHVDDLSGCGIDFSEKVYLFETADGNLGLCAKVDDDDDVASWLGGWRRNIVVLPSQNARIVVLQFSTNRGWWVFLHLPCSSWDLLCLRDRPTCSARC